MLLCNVGAESYSRYGRCYDPRHKKVPLGGGVFKALLFAALAASGTLAHAQPSWPAKPVTMVNPFAPGGGVDAFGRPLSAYLSKTIGQQFIVENIGGAGGTVGAASAARRPGDGYTFFLGAVKAFTPNCLTH
jgi:tripartite-type tricarboxylate transporter receptor subunit TctC